MSDHVDIPPNNGGGIDLETLVDALAENKEIGQPSEYFPSSGRVLEDSVDGTVYLGDGDQWLTVSTDSSLSSPAVNTDSTTIGGDSNSPEILTDRLSTELQIRPSGNSDTVGSVLLHPEQPSGQRTHWMAANDPDLNNFWAVKWEVDGTEAHVEPFQKGDGGNNGQITTYNFETFDEVVFDGTLRSVDSLDFSAQTVSTDGSNPTRWLTFSPTNDNSDRSAEQAASKVSIDGDNSAVAIMSRGTAAGIVTVCGTDSGGNKRFSDVVHFGVANPSTISQESFGSGLADGDRTYTHSSGDLQLAIDDSGTTYKVASALHGGVSA